jgi:hypothetical protein
MADTKISALTAATVVNSADQFAVVQSSASKSVTFNILRTSIGEGLSNASTSTVSAGYATDTYLAGSAISLPTTGIWQVGTILKWQFDMTKTALGSAAATIIIRMGTLGTTGDAAIATLTWGAGTAAADTGIFDVTVVFRTIGAGTSAVIAPMARCTHHLAATGLISTGASGTGVLVPGASSGFNSTISSVAGLSFNGGASFSGTNTFVFADADKL